MSKSPMDIYLDTLEWREVPADRIDTSSDVPYATHEGVIALGDMRLRVYQLNTGQRVIHKDDMDYFFDGLFEGEQEKVSNNDSL